MTKTKKILSILIPCTSVAVATAIITPAICLSLNNKHMTHDPEDRSKHVQTANFENVVFLYKLKDKNLDVSCFKVDWEYALSSHHKLHIDNIKLSINSENKLEAKLKIVNKDNAMPAADDDIGFNLSFKYEKDDEKWSADFVSYHVVFDATPGGNYEF